MTTRISIHLEKDETPDIRVKVFSNFEMIEFAKGLDEVTFYLHGTDASEKLVEALRTAYATRTMQG